MPTYEYRCRACGETSEIFHSMADAPKRKCPACGKLQLERLIGTGGGILFRGSGFYETDYRSDSYKQAAEADKPAPASESKQPEGSKSSGGASKSDGGKAKGGD